MMVGQKQPTNDTNPASKQSWVNLKRKELSTKNPTLGFTPSDKNNS